MVTCRGLERLLMASSLGVDWVYEWYGRFSDWIRFLGLFLSSLDARFLSYPRRYWVLDGVQTRYSKVLGRFVGCTSSFVWYGVWIR